MEKQVIKKKLEGEVVSDKMDKTVVISVVSIKTHSKYKKQYKSSKKYKAHDEKNQYKEGDVVIIEACRPLSADKRWRVIKKVK
ncbi:30S ribosomal protein S17 [Candidatus Parcubacteria bacterium]|jgi:small subunit ribosomal protein S17|nr:30S ribosomal protein S17 [Candidatus Parcubacteria bacterium]